MTNAVHETAVDARLVDYVGIDMAKARFEWGVHGTRSSQGASKKAASSKSAAHDDLTQLSGIGPRIATILADGGIDAEEAVWLRQMLFADGKISDEERKFLRELKGEATQVGPEFKALFEECMKQPPEQRTCG